MGDVHMPYSAELTPAEESLGYVVKEVDNPRGVYVGQPATVKAVAFVLGESDLIIKINVPMGSGVSYSHQRYGLYLPLELSSGTSTPDWLPVGGPYHDPAEAIRMAKSGETDVEVVPCSPPS